MFVESWLFFRETSIEVDWTEVKICRVVTWPIEFSVFFYFLEELYPIPLTLVESLTRFISLLLKLSIYDWEPLLKTYRRHSCSLIHDTRVNHVRYLSLLILNRFIVSWSPCSWFSLCSIKLLLWFVFKMLQNCAPISYNISTILANWFSYLRRIQIITA